MDKLIQELRCKGVLKHMPAQEAFKSIERADFVPRNKKLEAYQNHPISIGYGQTISQPYTVAFMLDLLKPLTGQKILEIGSGSGWQTALLAHIIGKKGKVFAMEIIPDLKESGEKNIAKYPKLAKRVTIINRNAKNGMPEEAPFDGIIAAAMVNEIPKSWKKQLKIGGRMVFPFRNSIYVLTKKSKKDFEEEVFPGFLFVPFV